MLFASWVSAAISCCRLPPKEVDPLPDAEPLPELLPDDDPLAEAETLSWPDTKFSWLLMTWT